MRKTIAIKVINIVVLSAFLMNSVAYGLSPMPGSTQTRPDGTVERAYSLGQKLFAARMGPGAAALMKAFEAVRPDSFTGAEPRIEGANFDIDSDYDKRLPNGWGNNEIYKIQDLKTAFEYFRDNEAQIPADLLSIEVGTFPVKEGELPISCIEKRGDGYALVIHEDFARMWNDLREHDVCFEYVFPDGKTRTLSLAWGIFYRVAKHEMGDLNKRDPNRFPKSRGHFNYYPAMGDVVEVLGSDKELIANKIAGRYATVNDAMWAWFLGSYCFANSTRYNNNTLGERLNWFFDGKEAREMNLQLEFPNLLEDRSARDHAIQLALGINFQYFAKGKEAVRVRKSELTTQELNFDGLATAIAKYYIEEGRKPEEINYSKNRDFVERAKDRLDEYVRILIHHLILSKGNFFNQHKSGVMPRDLGPAIAADKIPHTLDWELRRQAIKFVKQVFRDKSSAISSETAQTPDKLAGFPNGLIVSDDELTRLKEDVMEHSIGLRYTDGLLLKKVGERALSLQRDGEYADRKSDIKEAVFATGGGANAGPGANAQLTAARTAYRYISISMGGDKLAIAIIDGNNNNVGEPIEIRWAQDSRFNNGQIRTKTPEKAAEVMDAVVSLVTELLAKNNIKPSEIKMVNAGLAGPLDKTTGIFGSDFATPNLPFDKYPFRKELQTRLLSSGMNVSKIVMVNDGEAARNGEHYSPKGKLVGKTGGIVIIGGGINISVDGDDSIKECGHNLYQIKDESGNIHYAWGGIGSKGSHPIELGNTPEEIEKKCGAMGEEYILLGDAAFIQKYANYPFINWKEGLRDFEDMLSGPNIRERVRKDVESNLDKDEYRKLRGVTFDESLVGIGKAGQYERALTIAALRGNETAKSWITRIGNEVGLALAAFAEVYKDKPFAENLVLVSGVNENLGKGVDEVDGVDLYMRAVRESMHNELTAYFHLENKTARRLAEGVVRSDLTYERELVSYQPTDEEVLSGSMPAMAALKMPTLRKVLEEFAANSGLPISLKAVEPVTKGRSPDRVWSEALRQIVFKQPVCRRVEREGAQEERFTGTTAFASAEKDTDTETLPVYDIGKYSGAIRTGEQMRPVLSDSKAQVTDEAYFMFRGIFRNRADIQKAFYDNKIRYDVTIIPPARWGREPAKTYGHYHAPVEMPEIYQVISGEAWYLMQKLNDAGEVIDVILVKAKAGDFVIMLPGYGHVSINPSKTSPLIMANWLTWHQSSFYGSYKDNRGAAYYAEDTMDGNLKMTPNSNYKKVSSLREMRPSEAMPEFGLRSGKPIYNLIDEEGFSSFVRFLTVPQDYDSLLTPEKALEPVYPLSESALAGQPAAAQTTLIVQHGMEIANAVPPDAYRQLEDIDRARHSFLFQLGLKNPIFRDATVQNILAVLGRREGGVTVDDARAIIAARAIENKWADTDSGAVEIANELLREAGMPQALARGPAGQPSAAVVTQFDAPTLKYFEVCIKAVCALIELSGKVKNAQDMRSLPGEFQREVERPSYLYAQDALNCFTELDRILTNAGNAYTRLKAILESQSGWLGPERERLAAAAKTLEKTLRVWDEADYAFRACARIITAASGIFEDEIDFILRAKGLPNDWAGLQPSAKVAMHKYYPSLHPVVLSSVATAIKQEMKPDDAARLIAGKLTAAGVCATAQEALEKAKEILRAVGAPHAMTGIPTHGGAEVPLVEGEKGLLEELTKALERQNSDKGKEAVKAVIKAVIAKYQELRPTLLEQEEPARLIQKVLGEVIVRVDKGYNPAEYFDMLKKASLLALAQMAAKRPLTMEQLRNEILSRLRVPLTPLAQFDTVHELLNLMHPELWKTSGPLRALIEKKPIPALPGEIMEAIEKLRFADGKEPSSAEKDVVRLGFYTPLGIRRGVGKKTPAQPRTYDGPAAGTAPAVVEEAQPAFAPIPPAEFGLNPDYEHPLIKEIMEFKVPYAPGKGPGSVDITNEELENLWMSVNLFHKGRIKIIQAQEEIGLSETMRGALRDIKKRRGDVVDCKLFSNEERLRELLQPEEGVMKIVLTAGGRSAEIVRQLAADEPSLFAKVRSMNMVLPKGYGQLKLNSKERTFYQARMMMEAIFGRLYEKDNKTPMVEFILKRMLQGHIGSCTIDEFLDGLVESEEESPVSIAQRIEKCLKRIVSFAEETAEKLEHLKLEMKVFWAAA